MKSPRAPIAACALLALMAGTAAAAESGYERSEAARTCIRLHKIRSTEVIDRKHILFTLTNGETYVNKLPNACPGLRTHGAFVNYVSYPEICDLGFVTPLVKMGPGGGRVGTDPSTTGGVMPGYATFGKCALGKFEWVAKPDVEALRAELQEGQQEGEKQEPGDANAVQEADPQPAVSDAEPDS